MPKTVAHIQPVGAVQQVKHALGSACRNFRSPRVEGCGNLDAQRPIVPFHLPHKHYACVAAISTVEHDDAATVVVSQDMDRHEVAPHGFADARHAEQPCHGTVRWGIG